MTGRVEGKGIIITGAASGLGRAFAQGLASEGARVGVLDLNLDAAEEAVASIKSSGGKACALAANVTRRDDVVSAFDAFLDRFETLDVLFNVAGLNVPMHFLDVTEENWHAVMNVNGLGTLICMQEGARRMIPTGGGKIVNASSIAGRQGYPSFAPYSASKFAVNALTQAGARALADHNITVNAFAPGVVVTPLWKQLDEDLMEIGDADRPGQALAEFSAGILRGHAADPEELVGTALFLASGDSDYLTGQVFMVDGGMVLI